MTLKEEFHQEMLSGVQTLKKEYGYNPTYFVRMVQENGGVEAAKMLLAAPNAQTGLHELCLHGRLDLSMEAAVLNKKYNALFEPTEREIAKKRLQNLGYDTRARKPKVSND